MPVRRKKLQKASGVAVRIARTLAICAAVFFVAVVLLTVVVYFRREQSRLFPSPAAGGTMGGSRAAPTVFPTNYVLRTTNYVLVSSVYDGDTVYIKNLPNSVRLIGIDAPEVYNKHTEEPDKCGAIEAKKALAEMVDDREVVLELPDGHVDTDRYGRLLRYVWVCPAQGGTMGGSRAAPTENSGSSTNYVLRTTNCLDVGLELLRQGWARAYDFNQPHPKDELYREAQTQAKNKGRGMWGVCK